MSGIFHFVTTIRGLHISDTTDANATYLSCFDDNFNVQLTSSPALNAVSVACFRQYQRHFKVMLRVKSCQSTPTEDKILKFDLLGGSFTSELYNREAFFANHVAHNSITVEGTIQPIDSAFVLTAENTMHNVRAMFLVEEMTDFTIRVKRTKFPVHKLVLSCHSAILKAMMQSGMHESTADELIISDFSVEAVKCFVLAMYSMNTDLHNSSDSIKLEVLQLADKYQTRVVLDVASVEVYQSLSNENCLSVLAFADNLSYYSLKKQVLQYIKNNSREVVRLHKGTLKEKLGDLLDEVFEFVVL